MSYNYKNNKFSYLQQKYKLFRIRTSNVKATASNVAVKAKIAAAIDCCATIDVICYVAAFFTYTHTHMHAPIQCMYFKSPNKQILQFIWAYTIYIGVHVWMCVCVCVVACSCVTERTRSATLFQIFQNAAIHCFDLLRDFFVIPKLLLQCLCMLLWGKLLLGPTGGKMK